MPKNKAFTLLELIIVLIIIGVLATLGFTQYSKVVESTRLAEAKTMIGSMRQLATEYYWKNGSLAGIQNSDLGVNNTCSSSNYYRYSQGWTNPTTCLHLVARRCTSGGKTPNASRAYDFLLRKYCPGTGQGKWSCYYLDDLSACFGLPSY